MSKSYIMLFAVIFGAIGSYLPLLFTSGEAAIVWSILGGMVGGFFGIWFVVWFYKRIG